MLNSKDEELSNPLEDKFYFNLTWIGIIRGTDLSLGDFINAFGAC